VMSLPLWSKYGIPGNREFQMSVLRTHKPHERKIP
jgi:hypothetical protein